MWKGDKSLIGQVDKQNMTVHRWFANKSCSGDYLYNKHGEIAAEVNNRLGVTELKETTGSAIKAGDVVKIADNATYYDGKKTVPAWVKKKNLIVKQVKNDRAVIDKSQDGKNSINSPINIKFLTAVTVAAQTEDKTTAFKPYLVKVTTPALNIRKGAGTNFAVTGVIRDQGVYTIVEESKGWGKLKSGVGWISLSYTSKV